ncbi:MAG: hypothetical protein HOW73_21695 [Polyangiaceae bacterium]|nr:hypothetical protein [Polyangiaceae bacterium]
MRALLRALLFLPLLSCVRDVPVATTDAASPDMKVPAQEQSTGVLLADFDPDRVAPEGVVAPSGHEHHHDGATPAGDQATSFTCPHHPDVVSDKPGKCPKCGMDLVPKKGEEKPHDATTHGGH